MQQYKQRMFNFQYSPNTFTYNKRKYIIGYVHIFEFCFLSIKVNTVWHRDLTPRFLAVYTFGYICFHKYVCLYMLILSLFRRASLFWRNALIFNSEQIDIRCGWRFKTSLSPFMTEQRRSTWSSYNIITGGILCDVNSKA